MKREPVFKKPTYKYKGEMKKHPIERLEFKNVPENDYERISLAFQKVGETFDKAFKGVGRH